MRIKKTTACILGIFVLYPLAFIVDITTYLYEELEYLQDKLNGRFD